MTESLSLKCFCTRQGEVARLRFVFTLDTLKITVAAAAVVVVLVGVGIGTIVAVALEMGVGVVKPITHYHRLQDQTNPTARYKLLFASYRLCFCSLLSLLPRTLYHSHMFWTMPQTIMCNGEARSPNIETGLGTQHASLLNCFSLWACPCIKLACGQIESVCSSMCAESKLKTPGRIFLQAVVHRLPRGTATSQWREWQQHAEMAASGPRGVVEPGVKGTCDHVQDLVNAPVHVDW